MKKKWVLVTLCGLFYVLKIKLHYKVFNIGSKLWILMAMESLQVTNLNISMKNKVKD